MRPQDLLSLLGARSPDPAVESALVYYGVRNRPAVKIDEDDSDGPVVETQSWVKNSRAGIEFGFDDQAAWLGLDETEHGRHPIVLTQCYFYGRHQPCAKRCRPTMPPATRTCAIPGTLRPTGSPWAMRKASGASTWCCARCESHPYLMGWCRSLRSRAWSPFSAARCTTQR